MKKKISITLVLVMILSMVLSIGAYAKVNLPSISKNKPIITYTYNSSGKVYAYKAADLKTKTGGYIACSTDQCKIIEIKGNAVKVTYPVSKGTKTAWFSRDAFTKRNLANDAAQSSFNSQIKATTYKWKNNSATLGYVSKGDKVYLLRGDAKSNWLQILYPVSGGYKMGWITGSDYNKMITPTATPTATPKPTAKPVATPAPTAKPTAKPTATPKPTAKPTATPKATAKPTAKTKSLAEVAKAEVGYQGRNKNGKGHGDYTKYGKWYKDNGVQWCAQFVSWCVNQAGVSTSIVPKAEACTKMQKSKKYKKWDSSALKNINKNDVIFFCSNTGQESHHVGIVYKVSGSKITLIEGNTSSDIVKMNTYTVSNSKNGKIKNGRNNWKYFCGYIPVD